ncbi:MAG: tetratricopeptide repeat protein [Verrucomicrobiota bacterium]|nr:tetratricopeptide repeat protein [Verrucomicrobiota bacterium]
MQADAPTAYLFKLWPWIENNIKRIAWGAGILVVAGFVIAFYFWSRNQKEIAAGDAFTRVSLNARSETNDEQLVQAYLKVAEDYTGTAAAGRALLQAGAMLFEGGHYTNAQSQFQRFLDVYPDSSFAPQASLGVAACLEAEGQTNAAAKAYQTTISQPSDDSVAVQAKFSLARIDDAQGRLNDAYALYQEVAGSDPYGTLGREASLRASELKLSTRPATANPAPASHPFMLSTNSAAAK